MRQPWLLHFYPGWPADRMDLLSLSAFVGMWDGVPKDKG